MTCSNKQKRIKRVFGNIDAIAPLWAGQIQDSARCKNAHFSGRDLYSYGAHFLLGRLMTFNGVPVAAINATNYSRTTSGHTGTARRYAEKATHLTVEFERENTGASTTDAELCAAIIATLEKERASMVNTLALLEKSCYAEYNAQWSMENFDAFNSKVRRLNLNNLVIQVRYDFWSKAHDLGRLTETARENHRTRTQGDIVFRGDETHGKMSGSVEFKRGYSRKYCQHVS